MGKSVLNKFISQQVNNIDLTEGITDKLNQHYPFRIPFTITSCIQRVSKLCYEIPKKLENAVELRAKELKEKIKTKRANKDHLGSKAVQHIIVAEENAEVNSKIRSLNGPT